MNKKTLEEIIMIKDMEFRTSIIGSDEWLKKKRELEELKETYQQRYKQKYIIRHYVTKGWA